MHTPPKSKTLAEVRWGILGCGDVTERKSGPAFNQVEGSRLVAVMRRNAVAAEDYARRHGVPRWYSDADDLIQDPEVNAVYIATPPGSHAELAMKVAAAGKPCYVEKPMARTAAECAMMVESFEKAGLPLFVAYYRRALPHFQWVKQMIDSGELGALRQVRAVFTNGRQLDSDTGDGWRFNPEVSGGGLFWDLGSHALDLLDYWLGPLTKVRGHRFPPGGIEDCVSLTALCDGGVSLSANWSFVSQVTEDTVIVDFTEGRIHCGIFTEPRIRVSSSTGKEYEKRFDVPDSIQQPLIEDIVRSLRTGSTPLSTGTSGMRTNQVIDRVAGLDTCRTP
ncbi:MAG: Gfo/Idh/MocA family oxidoreductase [Kiritimatiellae bacterium]|jgi:1,5-anhydro-D-fructose reductase (1,5-anhydro-D-mannitol-forming)|nr:Gfo/Idh/MocA family oxidoreductase [Kiritimatiellia bacterium]